MATRGYIGYKKGKDIIAVYSHFDNYPQYTGKILLENYNESNIVELVENGGFSYLLGNVKDMREERLFYTQKGEDLEIDRLKFCNNISKVEIGCMYGHLSYIYIFDLDKKQWLYAKFGEHTGWQKLTIKVCKNEVA